MESLREVDEDITHRVLALSRGHSETRRVDHYQYHAWPDHGVPRTTRPLRALARLLVRGLQRGVIFGSRSTTTRCQPHAPCVLLRACW